MTADHFGRYEIRSELGRGGMATVFYTYDPRFERDVAIKVLPRAFLHDPQFRIRFDREAKTVALLEHPAIVPVYDFGEEDGQPYIVMRLMNGGSLLDKLEEGALSPGEVSKILHRLAQALDVAHSKEIIHRDIKPANILFDRYGNAFLSDFGIARIKETGAATLTGSQIIGTPAYMSPEQIQGDKDIDGRSDIYALGIILFLMLTNEMPFQADTPAKVMMMHLLEPVPSILDVRGDLPANIEAVIARALAKDPGERFATARQMAAAFDAAAQDIGAETLATARTLPAADPTVQASPQTRVSQPATKVAALPAAKPEAARSTRRIWFALGGVLLLAVILVATIAGFNAAGGGEEAPIALAASPTEVQATETPTPTEPAPSPTPPEPTPTAIPATPTGTPTPEPDPSPTEIAPPTPTSTLAAPIIGGADKIAFVADGDIWAANLDGSDRTQLTTDGGLKFNLEWDPDGQSVIFITGLCIKSVNFDLVVDIIVCFKSIDLLEGFEVSPDGQQIAISLDREIYIVPFDLEALNPGKDLNRNDLIQMATCEYLAPYNRNAVKGVHWSNDGQQIALMILGTGTGATQGLQVDLIQILDISKCVEKPPKLDGFPASRFSIEGYETTPLIPDWDWDGEALFTMNSLKRNGGFGDLYSYNAVRHTGEKINPLQGKCCYRGGRWSPDGRYLLFAFQEFSPDSVTIFYYVPFATLNTGTDLVPLSIPALTNPKEFPQPALRPAQTP